MDLVVHDNQVELWTAAFNGQALTTLFDTTTADAAIPVLDAATARFLDAPDDLRPYLAADDWCRAFRGNRRLIQGMRDWLATYDGATISSV